MDEASDIFDTPRARYLKLRTEFLRKARDYKFWGHAKSRQRVSALDALLRYCRQSVRFADLGTELRNDIHVDIRSFLLEYAVLPVPQTVREKLWSCHDAFVKKEEQEIPFIMIELDKVLNDTLAEFEKEECPRQRNSTRTHSN